MANVAAALERRAMRREKNDMVMPPGEREGAELKQGIEIRPDAR
jgi:hypothetical protein